MLADSPPFANSCFLTIVDGPALKKFANDLRVRKSFSPLLYPVLLVTAKRNVGLLSRKVWEVVDEVVTAPVLMTELLVRIENLLRTRRLTLELQRENNNHIVHLRELEIAKREFEGSKRILDAMLENLPMGIVIVSAPNAIITATSRFDRERFGNWIGKSANERARTLGLRRVGQNKSEAEEEIPLSRALGHGEIVVNEEWAYENMPEKPMVVLFNACPLRERNGAIIGAILMWLDISDREKVEEELRISEQRFHTLADHISQFAWMANEHGGIFWYNKRWFEFTGTSMEQTQGWGWEIVVHPDHLHRVEERVKYSLQTGEVWEDTFPMRGKNGMYRWFLSRAVPVHDENGAAILWFGTNTDITDRMRIEQELADERNFLSTILDTEGALVAILNPKGEIIRFNRSCEAATGYAAAEVIGKPFWAFATQEERAAVKQKYAHLLCANTAEYENFIIRKNGNKRFIRWRNTVICNNRNEVEHIIVTGIDITDRLEAEESIHRLNAQLQHRADELAIANKDLEAFSYSVSHDLRSPLGVIRGFSDILLDEYSQGLDDEGRSYLKRINAGVGRMSALIENLLQLSRVSRQELSLQDLDIGAMADSILYEAIGQDPQRNVEILISGDLRVRADPKQMEIALANLLKNSWKFTMKKEHTRIEVGVMEKDGEAVYFIRDNGAGFEMEQAEKLFTPFQRLHAEKEFAGTGVGLAIVERVIRRHKGRIWAEGEPGKGATFYFTLGTGAARYSSDSRTALAERHQS